MSRTSTVEKLPKEARLWLDQQLMESAFSGYDELVEKLNEKLKTHNLEVSVSRSAVGRYGKNLKDKVDKMRSATLAAQAFVDTMQDDEDALGQASVALAQQEIFQMLLDLETITDPQERALLAAELSKAISRLANSSTRQKKWSLEVRDRAQKVADEAAEIGKSNGLSKEAVSQIKNKILGIPK